MPSGSYYKFINGLALQACFIRALFVKYTDIGAAGSVIDQQKSSGKTEANFHVCGRAELSSAPYTVLTAVTLDHRLAGYSFSRLAFRSVSRHSYGYAFWQVNSPALPDLPSYPNAWCNRGVNVELFVALVQWGVKKIDVYPGDSRLIAATRLVPVAYLS